MTFNEKTISYDVIEKPTKDGMEYPDSNLHIGSMAETSTGAPDDCLCPIEENEVIIYGKKGTNYLVFTFLKKKVSYKFEINGIEDKIDCKILQTRDYLCALTVSKKVYLYFHSYLTNNEGSCSLKRGNKDTLTTHTYVQLFDYDINNQRYLFCAKNINSNNIECQYFGLWKKMECSSSYGIADRTTI